jgi:hypothetical protein
MRTIIAGSRKGVHMWQVYVATLDCGWTISTVLSGRAAGADTLGEQWAAVNAIPVEPYPADWQRYGKRAGMLRNDAMACRAEALIALWYNGSPGTRHMIECAERRGLRVYVMELHQ